MFLNLARGMRLVAVVAVIGFSAAAFAGKKENFDTCVRANSSWMSRWGQYVVAFDRSSAQKACASQIWWGPFEVRSTGCSVGGQWLEAGYYCNELSPGGN